MSSLNDIKNTLVHNEQKSFDDLALKIFNYQFQNNQIYREYAQNLGVIPTKVNALEQIPFLPIEFFKSFEVKSGSWQAQRKFLSSGTTSSKRSGHLIEDESFYHMVTKDIFEQYYPKIKDTAILALLPSYMEQGDSGLVSMIDFFIKNSNSKFSGYYLYDYDKLSKAIEDAHNNQEPIVLFGVSYALLEYSKCIKNKFPDLVVIETGGMKGRGEDLTKVELHTCLKERFGVEVIHSEYGMTELMSQAYSTGSGQFTMSKWMQILIRDINDPFNFLQKGKIGGINVIDLANIHSCSFVETKDIGVIDKNNRFEILGRIDNSDIRGCNLLIS